MASKVERFRVTAPHTNEIAAPRANRALATSVLVPKLSAYISTSGNRYCSSGSAGWLADNSLRLEHHRQEHDAQHTECGGQRSLRLVGAIEAGLAVARDQHPLRDVAQHQRQKNDRQNLRCTCSMGMSTTAPSSAFR